MAKDTNAADLPKARSCTAASTSLDRDNTNAVRPAKGIQRSSNREEHQTGEGDKEVAPASDDRDARY